MNLSPTSYFIAATGIAECIAQELETHTSDGTLGRPGRVCLIPGNQIVWDGCECGQLAIVFQHGPYPIRNFPIETVEDNAVGNCYLSSTAVRCVVSLSRCEYHPIADERGTPPSAATQTRAVLLREVEQYFMRQALGCCLFELREDGIIDDYRMGASDYQVGGKCGEVAIVFWMGIF